MFRFYTTRQLYFVLCFLTFFDIIPYFFGHVYKFMVYRVFFFVFFFFYGCGPACGEGFFSLLPTNERKQTFSRCDLFRDTRYQSELHNLEDFV